MSLSSTYLSRKQLIVDNLQSMGVESADVNDGLTTLANRILDIEPSITGLELDTSISCVASSTEVTFGDEVLFTSVLSANYDDTSTVDVDLSGFLTGATIEFYDEYTFLGSCVTGSDGVATFNYTFDEFGVYNIRAVFAGSNNFDSCVSSIVTVNVNYSLSISSDKSVLSYNDGDIANITCNVSDLDGGVSGETVFYQILHDGTVLDSGSDVTDSNGDVSIEYVSSGIGDVSVIFSLRSILQKTYELQDYWYYSTTEYSTPSADGTPIDVNLPSTFKLEFDINPTSRSTSSWGSAGYIKIGADSNNGLWIGQLTSAGRHGLMPKPSGTTQYCTSNTVLNTDNHIVLTFDGSIAIYTCNNESVSVSISSIPKIVSVAPTGNNHIKNIKVKAL